ncbi:MAG: cytochrome P450 [Bacillus sp. (in: firmicutes)]
MISDVKPHYNPLEPDTLLNPYPIYKKLREEFPIFWHEQMKSWVLTRHDDCMYVLRNSNLFARTRGEVPKVKQNLQSLDPPENVSLKSLMMRAFNSQDIEDIRYRVRSVIEEQFKKNYRETEFDWMKEVSAPLSLTLTSILLGVEEPDLDLYVEISDAIALQMDSGLSPENFEPGQKAREKLNGLADTWFASEGNTGILPYIKKNSQKANVPMHYIRNTTGTMFNASFGTLYAIFGNVLLTLLDNPSVLEQFKNEDLIDSGIDELIRFDGPAQGTSRFATQTLTLRDTVIKEGDIVLTLLAAANRDPEAFPNPDEIILDRKKNKHLGFGWGPHSCVGTIFGKLAVRELVLSLLYSSNSLKLVRTPTRRKTATVRCIDKLPVTFLDK